MTTKFIAQGDVLTHVAGGAIAVNAIVVIGALIGVAVTAAAASGDSIAVKTTGVWEVTKVGSQAWAIGDRVYYDAGNTRFTKTAADGIYAGIAYEAAGAGAGVVTGKVRLNGVAPEVSGEFAQAANVLATAIAITDSTTGTPDTSDPATLAAVTNPDLSDWNGSSVYPSAAQATAIGAAITSVKNSLASIAAVVEQNTADIAAFLASVKAANQMEPDA